MSMRWSAPYRSLAVVYALAILGAASEMARDRGRPHRERDIYGDPTRNYPDAVARLFPGSAEAEYLLGRRCEATAGRSFSRDELERDPALVQRFVAELKFNLQEAAGHYERAIALGMRSEENLYYNYALTLMRLGADPLRIDRAIADWRRNFPFSNRRDLELRRRAIEDQLRRLQPGVDSSGESQGERPES